MTDTSVICSVCQQRFRPLFTGCDKQAAGCASEYADGYIVGHFGSEFADLSVYRYLGSSLKGGEIICDQCLEEMLQTGSIIPDRGAAMPSVGQEELKLFLEEED